MVGVCVVKTKRMKSNSMIMIWIPRFIPNPSNCGLSYINYNSWTGDEMTMCGHNFCHYPVADRNEKCPIIPTYEETVAYENPC